MSEKEVLEHFDSIFGTNTTNTINLEDMKLLKILFEKFEEKLYRPSSEYRKLSRQSIKIADQLSITFTEEQQKLFEKLSEIRNNIVGEENEQFFYFGYIVCEELRNECKIKKE